MLNIQIDSESQFLPRYGGWRYPSIFGELRILLLCQTAHGHNSQDFQAERMSDSGKRILDVGCGLNKYPNSIGVDCNPRTDADVIHDLAVVPYPFADDEFDEIICQHVVEHVPDVMVFISELHRITKPAGRIRIMTPHYSNPDWPADPTHRNHLNSYSFQYFMQQSSFPFYTDVRLRPIRVYVTMANLWRVLGLEFLINLDQRWVALRFTRKFWEHYLNFIFRGKDLYFEFEVIKSPDVQR